eukprot:gene17560-biopygen3390
MPSPDISGQRPDLAQITWVKVAESARSPPSPPVPATSASRVRQVRHSPRGSQLFQSVQFSFLATPREDRNSSVSETNASTLGLWPTLADPGAQAGGLGGLRALGWRTWRTGAGRLGGLGGLVLADLADSADSADSGWRTWRTLAGLGNLDPSDLGQIRPLAGNVWRGHMNLVFFHRCQNHFGGKKPPRLFGFETAQSKKLNN